MEYRWINDIKEFQKVAKEWDEALLSSGDNNPFLLSDFILTWWKYYCNNKKLIVFSAYDSEGMVAGIPLCIFKRFGKRIITHVGGCHANLTHCILRKPEFNVIDSVISLLGSREQWDILKLDRVLCNNILVAQSEKCKSLNSDRLICSITDSGFDGRVDLTKGYKHIIDNLPKRLNRYLRSIKQKAEVASKLRLHKITGSLNVRNLFKEYRDLSIRSFRQRNKISAFEDKVYSSFYEEILEIFDRKKRLDAYRLTTENATLGITFGYRLGGNFKWILTVFNPDFSQLRPGHLLIDALIKAAIKNEDKYFDMYYGGEVFYKQQWCNEMIPLKTIQIYRKNLINASFVWAENALRSSTVLINAARRARNTFHKMKYANTRT